ncbi:CPBP family glutamic-type intramembrane protease [Luteimonas fraxinea]|uniref:CPBP family glutamic-type intramembrane protease n=1 Tax=Luteimonas fraxinea TaxID=2901869 RepID=A0ABS8UFV8_9GAMM|nr:CPBP family glutamic-type intramembrane protease [Luteimonas fraxinea]MCD9098397.1 CPBP family glutamic-type intramembrane protease [Luteimonas fraxinea]MCD9127129.1 CPBP family glutamic-type intramembrane protease [Luteimonas fraxinea]UHH10509.1 CPBP family glutamic-type intramembrane protease [Luteimonas fraxinea]
MSAALATPRPRQDLRIAVLLAAAAAVATLAVIPYLLQMDPARMTGGGAIALPALIAIQAMSMFILCALLAWSGLRMGHRVGLGAPLLQHWVSRHGDARIRDRKPWQTIGLGVAVAIAILVLSRVFDPLLLPTTEIRMTDIAGARSALYGLMGSFYGGIVEELQLRLFLMTLIAWAATWLLRRRAGFDGTLSPRVAWAAILIAALLFGLGHLPAASMVWGLDAGVVVRTLLLNGIGGVVFGWLYWKRGFEMAVLSHFAADLVLHALVPLLLPQGVL